MGDSYWWLAGKYKVASRFLEALFPGDSRNKQSTLKVLDIGCGPGNFLRELSRFGAVLGMDASMEALRICRRQGGRAELINSEADTLPVRSSAFDVVVMLDVLEHVADDRKVIEEAYRILRPGGKLLITVPAYKLLWGGHDELYGHYRRYRPDQVRRMVAETGFTVRSVTAFETVFLMPLLLFRKLKRIIGADKADDFVPVPAFLNTFLTNIICLDGAIAHAINHPVGVSIICTATKG